MELKTLLIGMSVDSNGLGGRKIQPTGHTVS
jgi:hypothetical protein